MKVRLNPKATALKKPRSQKSLLTAFTGIVPLLGIICVVLFSKKSALSPEFVLLSTLAFTVFATVLALALGRKFNSPH